MNWRWLLFSFRGRAGRSEFWIGYLLIVAAVGAAYVAAMAGAIMTGWMPLTEGSPPTPLWLGPSILFLTLLSGLGPIPIGIKRLHDRNKSGWWLLLYLLAPVILGYTKFVLPTESLAMAADAAWLLIWLWMLIDLGFLRGTHGPNRFGPGPLAP